MSFHYDIVKLNSVVDIFSGYAFNAEEMNPNDGIPLIKIKNVNNKKVSKECDSFLNSDAFEKKYEKYFLKSDDFLVAMTGQGSVGRIGKMRGNNGNSYLVNQRVGIVRVKPELAEPEYIYQCLARDEIENIYFNLAMGAGQPNLSPKDIGNLSIPLPPFPIQQKIAAILSRYDDLIENNLKQIKLLEEMAQITYQEWFVRLKFPNHENTPIDEETGLPVNWEKRKIKALCADIADGTHNSPKEVNEGIKLITGKHINDGFIDFENAYLISKEDHEQIKKRSGLNKGDILFSNIGTLGSIGVVTQDFEFSCKNVIIFKYKQGYSHFLYTYLANENTKNKLSAQSAGVAQKFYSLNFIRNFEDYLPTNELIELFDEKVTNSYDLKYQLHEQNQLLKEARDILLPRLMTGKITLLQVPPLTTK